MRIVRVILLGLVLAGCEGRPKTTSPSPVPAPVLHDLSTSFFTRTAHEFRLTDGTPCVAIYALYQIGVSCGWGVVKATQ